MFDTTLTIIKANPKNLKFRRIIEIMFHLINLNTTPLAEIAIGLHLDCSLNKLGRGYWNTRRSSLNGRWWLAFWFLWCI